MRYAGQLWFIEVFLKFFEYATFKIGGSTLISSQRVAALTRLGKILTVSTWSPTRMRRICIDRSRAHDLSNFIQKTTSTTSIHNFS